MELYQIRHFAAVAETGSFTKAAIRAAVSQPALSASIAKLEEELGVKLFNRSPKSVTPTPAGRRFHVTAGGSRCLQQSRASVSPTDRSELAYYARCRPHSSRDLIETLQGELPAGGILFSFMSAMMHIEPATTTNTMSTPTIEKVVSELKSFGIAIEEGPALNERLLIVGRPALSGQDD
jgi:hypothetical protein